MTHAIVVLSRATPPPQYLCAIKCVCIVPPVKEEFCCRGKKNGCSRHEIYKSHSSRLSVSHKRSLSSLVSFLRLLERN